jgi:FixJ family two-component response regulator
MNKNIRVFAEPLVSIVDDDESVRESTEALLRSNGFAVETFASASEFLSSPALEKTACLILDVRMPRMTGLELQRRLAVAHRAISVIFITSYDSAETREEALRAGAVDFLKKPFSEEALLRATRRALGTSSQ